MQAKVAAAAVLVNHGAAVDAVDSSGQTPLMARSTRRSLAVTGPRRRALAIPAATIELVKLLLANGARKEVKSMHGKTALDIATAFRVEDIIVLLH